MSKSKKKSAPKPKLDLQNATLVTLATTLGLSTETALEANHAVALQEYKSEARDALPGAEDRRVNKLRRNKRAKRQAERLEMDAEMKHSEDMALLQLAREEQLRVDNPTRHAQLQASGHFSTPKEKSDTNDTNDTNTDTNVPPTVIPDKGKNKGKNKGKTAAQPAS